MWKSRTGHAAENPGHWPSERRGKGEARTVPLEGPKPARRSPPSKPLARTQNKPSVLNPANRRIRTRTYGGVGGEESRDSPLSRFGTIPAFSARPCGYFRSGYRRRLNASQSPAIVGACPPSPARRSPSERCAPLVFAVSWSIARTTSAALCGSSTPHAKIHIGAGASLRGANNKPGRNHRGRS
jgi:hypothetical protein